MARDDGGKRFKYQAHDDEMRQRANQQGGNRDGFVIDSVRTWTPKKGENQVRLLPATWPKPKHYGFDVFVHFGIGMDNNSYLCLQKMKGKPCAICDEQHKAAREDEQELAQALSAKKRVASWIIDRSDERTGPQLWVMAWTIDRDICLIAQDKKTKEVYAIDHPDDGYDVYFTRQGEGRNTKYTGFQIDRKPSPISDDAKQQDEWLDYITDNPVPDLLVYQDEEKLEKMIGEGLSPTRLKDMKDDKKRRSRDDDDEDETPKKKRSRHDDDDEDEAPKKRRSRDEDDDEDEAPKKRSRDDDDDEDEPPARKRRSRDDDDDDDEDEAPKKKRSSSDDDEDEEPPAKKRRSRDDDDEDEDEPPPKKRKSRDDDDDDDPPKKRGTQGKLDLDDEDDEAPKKRVRSRLSRLKDGA